MNTKELIIKHFSEYNEDANRNWANEKILGLCNYKDDSGTVTITVSIGRWKTTYHDLVIDESGIKVKAQSGHNKYLDSVIVNIIHPIFFLTV